MKAINVEKKHSINTSDFRKFHVETSTFITNSGAMPAHQHKRKTPKTVLLTHITDHLQTGISKKASLIHHRGAPLAQLARAFGWFVRAGLQGRCHFVVSAGGGLLVFLCEGGL
ncbi:hypothetical protein BBP29_12780 [Alteromonas macleodii]|nr:hypothetical protein BBP29_12780 [Alteromonas macleodii]